MKKLAVSENRRYLTLEGEPFFWLGDTGWELFRRLPREEVDRYFSVRAAQGFSVIQAVALPEGDELRRPNAYGRLPVRTGPSGLPDPCLPDLDGPYSYWDHVDYSVRRAAEFGLVVALLPSWGGNFNQKWGKGPEILTVENARTYGIWIANRYRDDWNIVWVLGGDRPVETERHLMIQRALAEGLREGDGGVHLITYHPSGESSSLDHVGGEPWLDFHMLQTSHAVGQYDCWKPIERLYGLDRKPLLDSEPRYEDHPVCFDAKYGAYWDSIDARNAAYFQVFSGACGVTYGNHCVWGFNTEPQPYYPYHWHEALLHDGAATIGNMRKLIGLRPMAELRPAPELVVQDSSDMTAYVAACHGERYAFLYSPLGLPVQTTLGHHAGRLVMAHWYCPRSGMLKYITCVPNRDRATFVPPSQGRGQDWVLVLDAMD